MAIQALGALAALGGAAAPTALATGTGAGLAAGAGAGAGAGLGLGVFGPIAPSMAASAPFAVPEAAGLLQAMGMGSKAAAIPQITNPLSSIMSDPTYEMLKGMMQQQAINEPSQKLSPMQLASSPQVQIPQVNLMQLLSQIGGR